MNLKDDLEVFNFEDKGNLQGMSLMIRSSTKISPEEKDLEEEIKSLKEELIKCKEVFRLQQEEEILNWGKELEVEREKFMSLREEGRKNLDFITVEKDNLIAEKKMKIEALLKENEVYQKEIEGNNEEFSRFSKEKKELEMKVDEKNVELKEKEGKILELLSEIERINVNLIIENSEKISSLVKDIENFRVKLKENQDLLNEKEDSLKEKEQIISFLSQEIESIKARIQLNHGEISNSQQEKDNLEQKLKENDGLLKEKDQKISALLQEIDSYNMKIKSNTGSNFKEKLKSLNDSHESEMKALQDQLKDLMKHSKPQGSQKPEESFGLEDLKKEKIRLENLLVSYKLNALEEKNFLGSELKRAEEEAVDAKMKYAQVSMDKDYYQMKYQQLVKEVKKKGLDMKV